MPFDVVISVVKLFGFWFFLVDSFDLGGLDRKSFRKCLHFKVLFFAFPAPKKSKENIMKFYYLTKYNCSPVNGDNFGRK